MKRLHDLFPWRPTRVSTEQMDEIGRRIDRANVEDIEQRGLKVIASGRAKLDVGATDEESQQ